LHATVCASGAAAKALNAQKASRRPRKWRVQNVIFCPLGKNGDNFFHLRVMRARPASAGGFMEREKSDMQNIE
jgi:hypothetical protein